jgi:hypothetical protein
VIIYRRSNDSRANISIKMIPPEKIRLKFKEGKGRLVSKAKMKDYFQNGNFSLLINQNH